MPIRTVKGDIRLTTAQAIMLGLNTAGRVEVNQLETLLRDNYPVFFSDYRRMAHNKRFTDGQLWYFRDSKPWLVGAMVRETAGGTTRQRYIERVILSLKQDWQREGLKSLAIAPVCPEPEWGMVSQFLQEQLQKFPIPIFLYEDFIPEQQPDENSDETSG